jgi:hypothetical protein
MSASQSPKAEPNADQLFVVETDSYGKRLALVFGNHATNGQCPFYTASRCHHCDIGMGEGALFDVETNRQRLEWYQSHFDHDLSSIAHLVIYNSGSVLNPAEMPFEFLQDILAFGHRLTSVKVISLDSRESFVTADRILRIARQLRNDQCLRIIIGIESASDEIRNGLLRKEMSLNGIQRAFDQISKAAEQVGTDRIGIDVNILVGGPGTTSQTGSIDAADTARFALSLARVPVDFNLHPYYPSSQGLKYFPTHSRCSTSSLIDAVKAIAGVCATCEPRSRIYIGLNHEGHDTDSVGRLEDALHVATWVRRFNATHEAGVITGSKHPNCTGFEI